MEKGFDKEQNTRITIRQIYSELLDFSVCFQTILFDWHHISHWIKVYHDRKIGFEENNTLFIGSFIFVTKIRLFQGGTKIYFKRLLPEQLFVSNWIINLPQVSSNLSRLI